MANGNRKNIRPEWRVIIDTLRLTNNAQYKRICRRLLYALYRKGVRGAEKLIQEFNKTKGRIGFEAEVGENTPLPMTKAAHLNLIRNETVSLADKYFDNAEILGLVLGWIKEDNVSFLTSALDGHDTPFNEIEATLDKYFDLPKYEQHLTHEQYMGLRVSLIQRFLSDSLDFARVACDFVTVRDFHQMLSKMIGTRTGIGKTGGKGAGIFIAHRIIEKAKKNNPLFENVKVPKTWYLLSDIITDFIHYNSLEEVMNFKYKEIDEIRQEFHYFEQLFKNSQFNRSIVKGLSFALKDIGNRPIIIRSSSLLEDSFEASFAGKYKSLFLANTGTNKDKLIRLTDAIAEVFASVLNPDAIEYRKERGLIYFQEEMGCLLQTVIGKKIGKYFFPAFAGVAFSNNEIRWSSRIKRDDGVVRIVAGLGTRAVDRVAGDYPTLASPGQPKIRVNTIPSEVEKYSQKYIDVINVETGEFETLEVKKLLREVGDKYPQLYNIFSAYSDGFIKPINPLTDLEKEDLVVTFDGLFNNTPFLKQIGEILSILEKSLQTPVDVEFASDGTNLYILQCRPQYVRESLGKIETPKNIPYDDIIFDAAKNISEGIRNNIEYVVYIDPMDYEAIDSREKMLKVGEIVSELNSILPENKFILMGPGRWGSRGDIKLGVSITYSGISKTAALIEVAKKKQSYVPEVSFGTHFFQDLVESDISYLPLYPDDRGRIFNEDFLRNSENVLLKYVPWARDFIDVVRVTDVKKTANGRKMKLVMNADENYAVAFLTDDE